jgi:hypothetical protein
MQMGQNKGKKCARGINICTHQQGEKSILERAYGFRPPIGSKYIFLHLKLKHKQG